MDAAGEAACTAAAAAAVQRETSGPWLLALRLASLPPTPAALLPCNATHPQLEIVEQMAADVAVMAPGDVTPAPPPHSAVASMAEDVTMRPSG